MLWVQKMLLNITSEIMFIGHQEFIMLMALKGVDFFHPSLL